MKQLFTIIFLAITLSAFSQERKYDKTITLSELENILKNTNEHVTINNTHIKFDAELQWLSGDALITGKDAKFYKKIYDDDGNYKGIMRQKIKRVKTKSVHFNNCKIDYLALKKSDLGYLSFRFAEINDLDIDSCDLALNIDESILTGYLGITDNNFSRFSVYAKGISEKSVIWFRRNNFKAYFDMSGDFQSIDIKNNQFNATFLITNLGTKELILEGNQFITDTIHSKKVGYYNDPFIQDPNYHPSFIDINNSNIGQLNIANNVFLYEDKWNLKENIYNYNFNGSSIEELTISKEITEHINFNNATISKKITFDSLIINKSFSAENFDIPDYNINFTWELFKNKLVFLINDSTQYSAFQLNDIANLELYNEYVSTLNKFLTVFKNRGDLKSANACYVEMKDAETRRLKYLYETEGGTENYLNYNLNKFLKFFAEYGTSPVRSVQISGWVILIFACFYFFFYSDWDKISKKYLIGVSEKLISYFSSEQKLEDFYSERHKEDFNTFDQFKSNIQKSKHELPFFFMLFLKPLYWFSVVKYSFNKSLYKKVEFLQGRWSNLATGKKILLGTFTFLGILSYTGYLIIVRSLNSLILSINTFTTLGFGDIPVVGISRYIAILEGFLGWFLLSIFSVSLISQILQN